MTSFAYRAMDQKGREQRGVVEAAHEGEAIAILRARTLQVLTIKTATAIPLPMQLQEWSEYLSIKRYLGINNADRITFFRQLSLMLRAGNTLTQGLEFCARMTTKLSMRRSQLNILAAIQGGTSFAAALEAQGRNFPPIVAKLVASGEASGELQVILEELVVSLNRSAELKRQLISSMIHPLLMLVVSLGVVMFLALGIVPKFAVMLERKSRQLAPSTQLLMDISAWLVDYGHYLAIGIGTSLFMLLASYTTPRGKALIDRALLNTPMVGTTIRNAAMAQMGWTMSLLLGSGLTVLEALRVVSSLMGNHRLGLCLYYASEDILAGQTLTTSLKQRHIPELVQHMTGVGERSGELEHVMGELGSHYQHVNQMRIKTMVAMIGPVMTLFIGGMVGFVYYSFFSAMMQLSGR